MTKARLVFPCLPATVSSGVLKQQATCFAELVRSGLADAPTVNGFVPAAERVFLHSDEAPRRMLLDEAASSTRLAELLVGTIFPSVARLLEEGWNTDRLSFVDVTIASTRLQAAVRLLGHFTLPVKTEALLMIVPPWEQHSLPPTLAAARLRRMGVPIRLIQGLPAPQMLSLIGRANHVGVLISAGSHRSAGKLRPFIGALRTQVPRALPVVVGGPAMEANATACRQTGADLATSDLHAALSFCDFALPNTNTVLNHADA